LADKSASKEDRAEALKFVVHFVGDLHQPLHCAERNKDKGGNGRLVFFLDRKKAVNLHQVWDTQNLLSDKGKLKIADYAEKLSAKIGKADIAKWKSGTATDWANDSHRVAVEKVYAGVPVDGAPPKLGTDYVEKNAIVLEEQLEKGGIRLATVLNRAFGK